MIIQRSTKCSLNPELFQKGYFRLIKSYLFVQLNEKYHNSTTSALLDNLTTHLASFSNHQDIFFAIKSASLSSSTFRPSSIHRYTASMILTSMTDRQSDYCLPDTLDHMLVFRVDDVIVCDDGGRGMEGEKDGGSGQQGLGFRGMSKISRFKESATDPEIFRIACEEAEYCDTVISEHQKDINSTFDVPGNKKVFNSLNRSQNSDRSFQVLRSKLDRPLHIKNCARLTAKPRSTLFQRPEPRRDGHAASLQNSRSIMISRPGLRSGDSSKAAVGQTTEALQRSKCMTSMPGVGELSTPQPRHSRIRCGPETADHGDKGSRSPRKESRRGPKVKLSSLLKRSFKLSPLGQPGLRSLDSRVGVGVCGSDVCEPHLLAREARLDTAGCSAGLGGRSAADRGDSCRSVASKTLDRRADVAASRHPFLSARQARHAYRGRPRLAVGGYLQCD